MRKFKYIIAIIVALASTPAFAAEQCTNKVEMAVNGLVCDFCARSIESLFGKRAEVESIDVDLDNAKISIVMKDEKTIVDAELKSLITDAGYDIKKIKRGC